MRVTASTSDEEEFFRLIDWCSNTGQLGWDVSADRRDDVFLIRLDLEANDPRLTMFVRQVDGHESWTVHIDS